MSATATLLTRNAERCLAPAEEPWGVEPALRALVLTCCDHRVDPAHTLGVELGDAVVLRNPGGRVTPALVLELAVLATVAGIEGLRPEFELVIMHHTDCGTPRLEPPVYRGLLAAYFGIHEGAVAGKHVENPVASVKADIAFLRASPLIPRTLIVSGLVYDVMTRRARVACAPRPLGEIE